MNTEFPADMREFRFCRRRALLDYLWLLRKNIAVMGVLLILFRTLDLWHIYGLNQMLEFPWFMLESYGPFALIWLGYIAALTLGYRARLMRDKIFDVPHRFGFDEEGIYIDATPLLRSHFAWEHFNGWRESPRIIYMFTGRAVLFWHKQIWSEQELEAIRGHLRHLAAPRKVWLKRGESRPGVG